MSAYQQQTPEWIEMRKNYIGASDAPVIMEVGFSTPYQLWCEKLSLIPPKEKTAWMQRGLDLEEQARKEFEKQSGLIVFPEVVFSDKYDFMMASLDGIDIEHKFIVEIKVPGKEDHEKALDGVVPEKYIPQLYHQMVVTGLDSAFYFSYNEKHSKILRLEKDKTYESNLIKKEKEFWECVQNLEAPSLIEKDYTTREDDLWVHAASKWKETKTKMESLKEEEEHLRQTLICLSGKSNAKGAGIKLSKVIRKGSINYQEIPELSGMNLEKYRKQPIETWRIGEF